MEQPGPRPLPRARIVVAAVVEPPPRVEKGALLAQETREEVDRRRRPMRMGGGLCVGIGMAAFVPLFAWGPNNPTAAVAFSGAFLLLIGVVVLIVAGGRHRPSQLFENGIEWRDSVTNPPGYYSFHFVSEIRQVRFDVLGEVHYFKTRAGSNEWYVPAGSEFADKAVARVREVLSHPPRPEPKMNPWVAKPANHSSFRANVK